MNILVSYKSGSDLDKKVLEMAKKHAKAFNAKLFLLSSMEDTLTSGHISGLDTIKEKLEKLKIEAEKEGIPCESHLLIRGITPGEDIVEFAQDNKIDMIFIGIEKKSKVGKLIFGSNAQYIILESPCPVLSIK